MADGKVVIDVILDDGSVKKGVVDLDKNLGGLQGSGQKAALGIGKIVAALGLVALGAKAIDLVKSSLDGAISRYDTLNQFPRVMQLIGFDAEESEKAIGKLSDGIDGLPTTLDSVASSAQNIAIMTGDLDGAVDTTIALNNAFLSSGASSADAERGLQQYVQMLSKGEVDLQSWRTLQETMGVALNKTAEAFGFTGKSAQKDLYDALKDGEITFDEFNGKLIELNDGVDGFADMAAEGSAGIATSWQNMKTAVVKGLADVIGAIDEALGGTGEIEKIIDKMKASFQAAFAWIVSNIPVVAEAIKNIETRVNEVYEAIKPWLPLFLSVSTGILTAVTAFKAFAKVKAIIDAIKISMLALNTTMLANPIFWVVAAIVAAAALIYVYWEPISEFFIMIWDTIKTTGLALWEALKVAWTATVEFFISIWNSVSEFFIGLWQNITEIATNVWTFLTEVWAMAVETIMVIFTPIIEFFASIFGNIFNTISEVWTSITEMLSTVWEGIMLIAQGAWELIKNVILGPILLLINLLTGDFEGFRANLSAIWRNIASAASTIWTGIKTAVSGIVKGFINSIKTYWQGLKTNLSIIMNAIKSLASSIWNGIKATVSAVVRGLVSAVTGLWSGLKSTISGILSGIASIASSIWNGILSTVTGIVDGLVSGIQTAWDTIKSATQTAFDAVVDFIKNPLEGIDLLSIGKDIIQGLINGIKSKVTAVADAVTDVASKITGKIKSILGIKSPSRVLKQIGVYTGEGLELGIGSMAKSVGKASAKLADAAIPEVESVGFTNKYRGAKPSIRGVVPISATGGNGGSTSNDNRKSYSPQITNYFTPAESTPSESSRKQKQQLQRLGMGWG